MDVLWGSVGQLADNHPLVVESEEYVANKVLPKEGYSKVLLTRSFDRSFPVDAFAEKDGTWYGFDISLAYYQKLRPDKTRLFEHLGIRTVAVFLRPDKSAYFIKEYDALKSHISCIKEFRAAVRK